MSSVQQGTNSNSMKKQTKQRRQQQQPDQKKSGLPEAAKVGNTENLLDFGDPDAWDDTALIAAYDETVKQARELALGGGHPMIPKFEAAPKVDKQSQQPTGQASSSGDPSSSSTAWQVGSLCRAVWSEDGLVYSARILSLNADGLSCLVEYTDYGNQEVQLLSDLLIPAGEGEEEVQEPDDAAETDVHLHQQPQPQPHPPVPRLPDNATGAIDEATYNMLMSWYMSGYYTGYYVGKREAGQ